MVAPRRAEKRTADVDHGHREQRHLHLDKTERGGHFFVQDDGRHLLLDGSEEVSVRHAGVRHQYDKL